MSVRSAWGVYRKLGVLLLVTVLAGCDNSSESDSTVSLSSSSSASSSSGSAIPEGHTLVIAVNAGGPSTMFNGVEYKADQFSTGGIATFSADAIKGVDEDTLYQSERYGSYKYEIPVTNASYSVKLHFAELYHETPNSRQFSVSVEGEPVVQNLDLFSEVGQDTAVDFMVSDIVVADNSLTIELTPTIENATLGGFAIFSDSGGEFIPPSAMSGCDLPSYLQWTSSPAIISPRGNYLSVKDPSIVFFEDKYHVFATAFSSTSNFYESIYLNFTDFDDAPAAALTEFAPGGSAVAPQVFYFRPHKRWYIITQWPAKYSTSADIANPASWTPLKPFWPGDTGEARHSNALDFWVICDDSTCYMFFFKDDGKMYQVKTPINNFPNFDLSQVTVANVPSAGPQNILFEAGNVYKIKGHNKYLLMVEGWGAAEGQRLYRAWTSTALDGPWIPYKITEKHPFAGLGNVKFPDGQWSHQISHGEMVRAGWDETMELDACNMKFLYQGADLNGYKGDYNSRPYKLGLLTAE